MNEFVHHDDHDKTHLMFLHFHRRMAQPLQYNNINDLWKLNACLIGPHCAFAESRGHLIDSHMPHEAEHTKHRKFIKCQNYAQHYTRTQQPVRLHSTAIHFHLQHAGQRYSEKIVYRLDQIMPNWT